MSSSVIIGSVSQLMLMLNMTVSFTEAGKWIISDVFLLHEEPCFWCCCSWEIFSIYLQWFYCQFLFKRLETSSKQVFFFVPDQESRTCSVPSGGVLAEGCRIPAVFIRTCPQMKASNSAWLKASPCLSPRPLSCPDRPTWCQLARARSLQVGCLLKVSV